MAANEIPSDSEFQWLHYTFPRAPLLPDREATQGHIGGSPGGHIGAPHPLGGLSTPTRSPPGGLPGAPVRLRGLGWGWAGLLAWLGFNLAWFGFLIAYWLAYNTV